MNEELLHYVWQHKKFLPFGLKTTDGTPIEIIDVGQPNTNAGADFSNAKIRIGELLWAGDVEIHLKASDWHRHGHDRNVAYNNVILHVVAESDSETFDTNSRTIPQFELKIPDEIVENLKRLAKQPQFIPCERSIAKIDAFTKKSWLETLLFERFMRKTNDIKSVLEQNANDWECALYQFLVRNFGFGKNADAFTLLAKSLPLAYLRKHRDNLLQVEALLFGQAGLLPETFDDDYAKSLQREYTFLSQKFQISPISSHIWKMFRLRPMNFPHVRIAQFAALIHSSENLFSKIIERPTIDALRELFKVEVSDYWATHYNFRSESKSISKHLTDSSINAIIINTVVPFLFAYGQMQGQETLCERAIALLNELPAEQNSIIGKFETLGFTPNSAAESQALIQLKTCYCDTKNCLRCRFCHEIVSRKINEKPF